MSWNSATKKFGPDCVFIVWEGVPTRQKIAETYFDHPISGMIYAINANTENAFRCQPGWAIPRMQF